MTKPPVPDNPITDFMNSDFTVAFDWSLLAMMLISTALVAVYVGAAMLIRGNNSPTSRSPKGTDLAFGLAIATPPLAGLLVLGRSGLGSGLIIGGFALVIGLTLWGGTDRGTRSETSQAPQ